MPSPDFEKLEHLIHRNLRALPGRTAPAALEARVLAAIARREALPWWRRSYPHWPAALRGAFILLLTAAAAGILAFGRSPATAQALGGLALRFPWLALLQSAGASLAATARAVADALPQAWLYGLGALLAAAYGILLGLGAVAYRAFYPSRPLLRPFSS